MVTLDKQRTKYTVWLFSCSAEHEIVMQTNLRILTIANSFMLNIAEHVISSANKYENANNSWHFHIF